MRVCTKLGTLSAGAESMMHLSTLVLACLLCVVRAQQTLPQITLPWGTWQALPDDDDEEKFWHIPNIRFGNDTRYNRFKAPVIPPAIADPSKIADNTYGPACIQIAPRSPCSSSPGAAQPIPRVPAGSDSEDCLFLDVYIPKDVNMSTPDTPVVVWFYGGAFIFGSKGGGTATDNVSPFYVGRGLIEAIQYNYDQGDVIFVAGNYRLGAFGWLAGPTMQGQGLPNVGIHDQKALLSWVQKYIHMVGGDNTSISVWGESAGASSIMHHLVQQDGEPLIFKTALLQSPAFEWQWDNSQSGPMETNFNDFAKISGCGNGSAADKFSCLQNADVSGLSKASEALYFTYEERGLFPYGPAVDNISFPLLAPVALESEKYKQLDALIVSHVYNESGTFTPPYTSTEQDYNTFVTNFIPESNDSSVTEAIIDKYPSSDFEGDQFLRLSTTIRDVSFTCNTRYLYDAYANIAKIPVYMMQYSVLGTGEIAGYDFTDWDFARHASDLLPTFFNRGWDFQEFIEQSFCVDSLIADVVDGFIEDNAYYYQQYLASYVLNGDPGDADGYSMWNQASNDSNFVINVLNYGSSLGWFGDILTDNDYADTQNTWEYCGFWLEQAKVLQANVQKGNRAMARDDIGPELMSEQVTLASKDDPLDMEL